MDILPPIPELPEKNQIEWEQIRSRLEAARSGLHIRFEPSADARREVLRARAKVLAQRPEQAASGAGWLPVVEFRLAYENYAVEARYVREICPLKDLRPLPGTPPFVLGLINVRGQILSVVDIKKFFDLPEKGLTDLNKVLILKSSQMEIGILADAVLSLRSIAPGDLEAPVPTLTGIRASFAKGVTRGPMVLLDVEKILSDPRVLVDEG
jgi:purine-binding chemotaxis protein CheW